MKVFAYLTNGVVRKLPGQNKWRVYSEDGKNLGTYDSYEAAEKRRKQIEMFKHIPKGKRRSK